MTEADWLSYTDPARMVAFVGDKVSSRKLRLFACACCRRIWDLLADPRSRKAVETAERFADGLATPRQLRAAKAAAMSASLEAHDAYWDNATDEGWKKLAAAAAAAWVAEDEEGTGCISWNVYVETAEASADPRGGERRPARVKKAEKKAQCALLRDIAGNPFRPVASNPAWLCHASPTVLSLARAIYEEGRFTDLPVLGDALEEAGCDDEVWLDHCRAPTEHVPGCWLVDALLGKG
jgi:hypothetical protein